MSPTRIMHVFGRMQRGGAEMRTLDVMRRVDRDRYEMSYCALSGLPGDLDGEIRELGGEIYYCRLSPSFPIRFYRLLKAQRIDVVQSHIHHSSGLMLLIAWIARVPNRIMHFRTTGDGHASTLRRRAQRWVLKRCIDLTATSIIGVSDATLAEGWSSDWRSDRRCRVIYNGIDVEQFAGPSDWLGVRREFALPDDSTIYIVVGRINDSKNQIRMLGILAALLEHDPTAYLLLVGRGDNRIEHCILREATRLRLKDRVTLTGVRSDVPRLLRASNLMFFPSKLEGLPGAVLEAAAAGTPVVCSDLPMISEITRYLPGIHSLSLDVPDDEWATVGLSVKLGPGDTEARQQAVGLLKSSPFALDRCVNDLSSVWCGHEYNSR